MTAVTAQFIGGPWDGQTRVLPESTPQVTVPIGPNPRELWNKDDWDVPVRHRVGTYQRLGLAPNGALVYRYEGPGLL